eukprot:CAMPEP_0205819460 /NCGR_PEP_ID=MMETSP0206-20130828/1848_1 /ASSEMBLY_ACC=CAM_ASM_000279 /TAXON_ID=36767 /ORGANISM="Euplotes focardii, Strain TN1" /LENGTH=119 /DNA_ID=CAMNT_0053113087 /DNA_START=203 /DNA_END=562 /DNA_ORIENTATION=-
MAHLNLGAEEALKLVQKKHSKSYPNENFRKQLNKFDWNEYLGDHEEEEKKVIEEDKNNTEEEKLCKIKIQKIDIQNLTEEETPAFEGIQGIQGIENTEDKKEERQLTEGIAKLKVKDDE